MVRELLFQIKKKIKAGWHLRLRQLQRALTNKNLSEKESFNIPIIINNYNRLTYLKQLLSWLQQAGYTNIFIIDNQSTYPPLLEFYKTCGAKLILPNQNLGFKALWLLPLFEEVKRGYYVYTDSDVIPNPDCPKNIVYHLYQLSKKFDCEKIGPALQINDLPDYYAFKQDVLNFEKQHWSVPLQKDVYDAPIDTTFALYKPFAQGAAEESKGVRVAGVFTFKHLPWYMNTKNPDEEEVFYKSAIVNGKTMWSEKT
jgi:hypothetical protein